MAFNLENRNKEVDETPETQIDNESLAETEESSEDFDSCELREVDDRSNNEVSSKTLEETDDDFEDCESKFEQAEDESAEADEGDSDDFDDCGNETEDEYTEEVTSDESEEVKEEYEAAEEETEKSDENAEIKSDDETSEETDDSDEYDSVSEMNEETDEDTDETSGEEADQVSETDSGDETEEISPEDLEEMEEDEEIDSSEIDEEAAAEDISEQVEEESGVELSDEAKEQVEEEVEEEIDQKAEDDSITAEEVEEIQEEKAAEETEEVEEKIETAEEASEGSTEEIEDSDELDEKEEQLEEMPEEIRPEDLEKMEEDEEINTSEIDEEAAAEDISEQVEEESGVELSDEAKEQVEEEVEEEIDQKAEDDSITAEEVEEIQEEKVAEETDEIEEKIETAEEATEGSTEEIEDSDELDEKEEQLEEMPEEIRPEDLEKMEEDEEINTSEIDEEAAAEDISEQVEEESGVELSDEAKEQVEEEVAEEIDQEAEDDSITAEEVEEIQEEKAAEETEEVEERLETVETAVEENSEQISEKTELSESDVSEELSEEVSDEEAETLSDEEINERIEDKADEIKEEAEKAEEESLNTEKKSLSDRIKGLFKRDNVSVAEVNDLKEENEAELEDKRAEKETLESEYQEKFNNATSVNRNSEDYRKSLDEFNDVRDRKIELDDEIKSMEQQQELLNQKSVELREAQIEKGKEAIEQFNSTKMDVDSLQERYDQTYYDRRPNKKELSAIREESGSVLNELTSEKDSVRLAMEAKMDEISEYVRSNNMDRYDTAHDSHYQKLSEEYAAMKEQYQKIDYSIVKLDENNKAITEILGDEYVPVADKPRASKIEAVNEGSDVPGETDYFTDEARAQEVLSSFKQDSWEELNLREQKRAIEKLADYNADILGIEDKPKIIYYNAEDPSDFGGYSEKLNAIYINEYNMNNAAETADTISHEYRHKYQHERAEKLETERDLEFREGFDNYIRAEDDYAGYKNQLVESDARAYAQLIKDKIQSYSESSSEADALRAEQGKSASRLSGSDEYRKTKFEKVKLKDLPEDFEKKENLRYKEIFEAKELDELKSYAREHYENGKKNWSQMHLQELQSYKEHSEIENGHIEKVHDKSLEAADALEDHFKENDYGGLFSPEIDRKTLEAMAIYHDTGMDGNIKAEDFEAEHEKYLNDPAKREEYVNSYLERKAKEAAQAGEAFDREQEVRNANADFEERGYETHFRSQHSLESAIHVLRDREKLESLGVDADEVALGCLVHSKSNSGLRHIESEKEWGDAIKKIQDRVEEFNKTHPDEQINFDSSFLMNEDGSFKQDKLAVMRSETVALRIGDANGHDCNSKTSQSGKSIEFSLEKKTVSDELPEDIEAKINAGICKSYLKEVQAADVKVDGIELNNENDPSGAGRMFAVGEGNFESLECKVNEQKEICQEFKLCDGNAFPLSTQSCIEERIEEYKSAEPLKYTIVIKLGSDCSKETERSYRIFKKKMRNKYQAKVRIEL